ncbi:beta-lactamase family protein, partial [bacterium]|nr:beta-lactamase family protein [bacterium]
QPWTRFAIASMTKPITATAVMILQQEGKLDVNDELSKYLPEFREVQLKSGESLVRPLTIRDALTHTSGIVGDQVFRGSLEDHVKEVASRPLGFQPGTKWQYSPGVSVAGRIVEVVSEQPFESFLKERIFSPLRMNNTMFRPDEKGIRNLAKIYQPGEGEQDLVFAGNRISTFEPTDGPNPSGGLVSTAQDLFRFYQMVLNGGEFRGTRILEKQFVDLMTSPQIGDLATGFTPGNTWGLGWCLVREPQGVSGMLSVGTFGHGGAFGTQGWVDPKTETIFVLLIQRTNMGNSDGSDLRKDFQQAAVDAIE